MLADLLSIPIDDPINNVHGQLNDILQAVLSNPPQNSDATLAPAWSSVLGHAMVAYHGADPDACAGIIAESWKTLWSLLESSHRAVRTSAADALDSVVQCFTPTMINAALSDSTSPKSVLRKIISQVDKALDSLAFAAAVPEVLQVLSSLITGLRYRGASRASPTAAEKLLLPLITRVAELRVQKTFEYKEAADVVCSTAMRVLGPEVLLRELPLNLEPADRCVSPLHSRLWRTLTCAIQPNW